MPHRQRHDPVCRAFGDVAVGAQLNELDDQIERSHQTLVARKGESNCTPPDDCRRHRSHPAFSGSREFAPFSGSPTAKLVKRHGAVGARLQDGQPIPAQVARCRCERFRTIKCLDQIPKALRTIL